MNITKLLSDADAIQEKTTAQLKATLVNENSLAIPGSSLLTLTLTLYSIADTGFPLVAARNAQNVLNTNDVAVNEAGELTWDMTVADTVILNGALTSEVHRAVFEWTYLAGAITKTGRHAVDHRITNMEKII